MIPLRSDEGLSGYVERGASVLRPIGIEDLVTDATSILDLVDILLGRPRVFVLARDRIGGYVHFSDLNRPIVKLPFFVLLEAVERHFFDGLAPAITPDVVKAVVDPQRFDGLSERMARQQAKRANLNWAALLSFKDLLLCARHLGVIATDVSELDNLSRVRNLVCHAAGAELLVEDRPHVRRLADAKTLCLSLLQTRPRLSSREDR